jgi:hypothetical protein
MMTLVAAFSNLALGLAYAGLGLLSAWEAISLHRYRGWSRFGLGFTLMAASCGPHHLAHGWHLLHGESAAWPMFAVTLIGMPSGLIFLWLRFEAIWGGRGERWVTASPDRAVLFVSLFGIVGGWLAATAYTQGGAGFSFLPLCTSAESGSSPATADIGFHFTSITFLTNLFVTGTYGMVGWYLGDREVRRYFTTGNWSLSGVALTGVFFTCAQMHLVDATTNGSDLMLVFDLIGVPASVYFLRVVKQVHNDSVMDWNRRPLVGAAAAPARPSPWSAESAHS